MNEERIEAMPRLIAVPLFLVLVVVVAGIWIQAFAEHAATRAEIAAVNDEIALYDARLANGAADAGDNPGGQPAVWISAPTQAVAAASIQKVVGDIITGAKSTVREVQVMEPDPDAPKTVGPQPVSATFLFETTHQYLRQILMTIEPMRPLLTTEAITIEAMPKPEGSVEVPLRVELRLTGYFVEAGA
jgi:hypothetical protein